LELEGGVIVLSIIIILRLFFFEYLFRFFGRGSSIGRLSSYKHASIGDPLRISISQPLQRKHWLIEQGVTPLRTSHSGMDTALCTPSVVVLGEDKLTRKTDRRVVLGESSIDPLVKVQTPWEECHCWLRLIRILNFINKTLNSKACNCRQSCAYSNENLVKSTVDVPITQEKI
jgi:hypothetical protein